MFQSIFQSISLTEWLIIALILIVLFGRKKIPDFFKGLADAVKEFKKGVKGSDKQDSD